MAVDNRLTAEQLAALVPGSRVTIEFVRDFRQPKLMTGIVLRLVGSRIVVSCRTDRGGKYVHEFDRRSGLRVGSEQQAELVAAHVPEPTSPEQRRQAARVDAAYREWARNRGDVERLRLLRAAIEECLDVFAVFLPDAARLDVAETEAAGGRPRMPVRLASLRRRARVAGRRRVRRRARVGTRPARADGAAGADQGRAVTSGWIGEF